MSNAKKSTKEYINEYLDTRPETTVYKIRGQIDRPDLYEYEKRIGKSLFEMDSLELAEMLMSFIGKRSTTKQFKVSCRSYDTMLSLFRNFFDWYIDNVEVIKNPCNDKRIKGKNALLLFGDSYEVFTKDSMEELITEIRNDTREEYADYEEAMIRMYYEGFSEPLDIVNLKEEEVNHEKKTAMVRGKEVQLSDRLYELLVKLHNMDEYPAFRGSFMFLSYRGSYFKFPTRASFENEFNERPPEYWAGHLSRLFNREIAQKHDTNINARTIYLRGFYDYMVKQLGQEETDRIISSTKDPDCVKKLKEMAEDYNVVESNITTLKKVMMQFVEDD